MILLYIIIILLGIIPLWKTISFILLEEKIRKDGISTTGIVSDIQTKKFHKGPTTCRIYIRYNSIIAGQYQEASFVTSPHKYKRGQSISLKYLPEYPDKIIVAAKRGYWSMLVFSILIALFVVFAMFKIDGMLNN
jgi:hypothetical protein